MAVIRPPATLIHGCCFGSLLFHFCRGYRQCLVCLYTQVLCPGLRSQTRRTQPRISAVTSLTCDVAPWYKCDEARFPKSIAKGYSVSIMGVALTVHNLFKTSTAPLQTVLKEKTKTVAEDHNENPILERARYLYLVFCFLIKVETFKVGTERG